MARFLLHAMIMVGDVPNGISKVTTTSRCREPLRSLRTLVAVDFPVLCRTVILLCLRAKMRELGVI